MSSPEIIKAITKEIEVKIIGELGKLADPTHFGRRLAELGGRLYKERRLLKSIDYNQTSEPAADTSLIVRIPEILPSAEQSDGIKNLLQILQLLGLEIVSLQSDMVEARVREPLPPRSARLRDDGGKWFWAVKSPRPKAEAAFDNREEAEAEITDPDIVESLLRDISYTKSGEREKYRTTCVFGDQGEILVELNEAPEPIPPWLEVEASTEEDVRAMVERLGFAMGKDTRAIGDTAYYQLFGLTKEQARNLKFHSSSSTG